MDMVKAKNSVNGALFYSPQDMEPLAYKRHRVEECI